MSMKNKDIIVCIALFAMMFNRIPCAEAELRPKEILVVANKAVKYSEYLARYYMEQRKIPVENLLLIQTSQQETVARDAYDSSIAAPVGAVLAKQPRLRCVVTMFGIPLRVGPAELNFSEKANLRYLRAEVERVEGLLKEIQPFSKETLKGELSRLKESIDQLRKVSQLAAVDSELALVLRKEYPLDGWLPNPVYSRTLNKGFEIIDRKPVMVSRLDGPNETIVKRIIDDSIAVEQVGLSGTAYFDARWRKPDGKKRLSGYALYDNSLHRAAEKLRKKMPVVLDQEQALIPEGSGLPAVLYSGWYSLARYVDAFVWLPGSVGYHIASSECTTLKKENSTVWCKMMLEKGVAATIGPVSEPYVQAFPLPELFFGLLTDGKFNLVESYFASLPYLSWRVVLIGDPLYRPYKNTYLK